MRCTWQVVFVASAVLVGACGSNQKSESSSSGSSSSASARVYFVEPKDGATVKSPVHLKFGIDNYQLAAVPQGTVESARPGTGHHHVGVDQDCLASGTTIVKGTPSWVHFGDGKTEIDMQLPPGQHKLSLQLGDDLHRAVDNLCQTITVNVVE